MMAPAHNSLAGEPLFAPSDIARLFQLVAGIADERDLDPAQVIDRLEHGISGAPQSHTRSVNGVRLGEFVARLRKIRMTRNEVIGAQLFRDPAWDMLLDLYAASERGERLLVSALCFASGVPQSTALRTVQRLEELGMIVREGDPNDLRRSWVRASPDVLAAIGTMAGLFAEAVMASAESSPNPTYEEADFVVPISA